MIVINKLREPGPQRRWKPIRWEGIKPTDGQGSKLEEGSL